MWTANHWKDYEVIDTSGGEKLERWGKYILLRPDPQVIWNTPKEAKEWKALNGHYHRSSRGGGEWEFHNLPEEWSIQYKNLTFRLKPFSFKHTGLFPEQAVNWDWTTEIIQKAGRPVKVLNLFPWLPQRQALALPMWMRQKAWLPGQRKTPPSPDFQARPSVIWWTTAQNSWNGKSAGATHMTALSWTRPPMGGGLKEKSGKSRTIFIPCLL